jgi:hypothetical protein
MLLSTFIFLWNRYSLSIIEDVAWMGDDDHQKQTTIGRSTPKLVVLFVQ